MNHTQEPTHTTYVNCLRLITADESPEYAGKRCGEEVRVEWQVVHGPLDAEGCPTDTCEIVSVETVCGHTLTNSEGDELLSDYGAAEAEKRAEG